MKTNDFAGGGALFSRHVPTWSSDKQVALGMLTVLSSLMVSTPLATDNDIEELLSEALLIAIAAGAGFLTSKPSLDRDSTDLMVHGGGDMCPAIAVQLKASVNLKIQDGVIKFQLPVKNYNDLRKPTMIPRMLVLMRLPKK